MFNKAKRYFSDNAVADQKDLTTDLASLFYEIANDDGIEILYNGSVFIGYWFTEKKSGLEISFGSPSVRLGIPIGASQNKINIKDEVKKLYNSEAIKESKKQGKETFSNLCTFAVLNKLNKIKRAKLVDTVRIFKLPMQEGFVRCISKEYAEAKTEKEKIKLLNKNNPKTHLFFQAALSIGHAKQIEDELKSSNTNFDFFGTYTSTKR